MKIFMKLSRTVEKQIINYKLQFVVAGFACTTNDDKCSGVDLSHPYKDCELRK